jgi:hypothetical protein
MNNGLFINIPQLNITLFPGSKVQLSRFQTEVWVLNHGWYSFDGNRAVCGWYLTSADGTITRSLQLTDLDDIYSVSQ